MKLIAISLLISISALSMEDPESFRRQKYIIYAPANPSPRAQELLKILKLNPETHFHLITSVENPPRTMQNHCCKYVSNELKLMLPAMAVTACSLCATTNLSCSQGLSIGCGSYLLSVLCLSDENESLSRQTYSGQAALYLKRRLKEKASTIFPCLVTKRSAHQDE